jgi:hypothetical protein
MVILPSYPLLLYWDLTKKLMVRIIYIFLIDKKDINRFDKYRKIKVHPINKKKGEKCNLAEQFHFIKVPHPLKPYIGKFRESETRMF